MMKSTVSFHLWVLLSLVLFFGNNNHHQVVQGDIIAGLGNWLTTRNFICPFYLCWCCDITEVIPLCCVIPSCCNFYNAQIRRLENEIEININTNENEQDDTTERKIALHSGVAAKEEEEQEYKVANTDEMAVVVQQDKGEVATTTTTAPPSWSSMKALCDNVMYDMKIVVVTFAGHLEGYGSPVATDHGTIHPACVPVIVSVVKDERTNQPRKKMTIVPTMEDDSEEEEEFWMYREVFDVGTRTFHDIATAIDAVRVDDDSLSYFHKLLVPMNCGTFVLELGKQLKVPIDNEIVTFVLTHMKDTMFVQQWMESDTYQQLSTESWFGGTTRRLATTFNVDGDSMIRRLLGYMLDQQYPQDLIYME